MSDRTKVLIKTARILQGLPGCEDLEELEKAGGISGKAVAGIIGGTVGAAGIGAGGYLVGKKKGLGVGREQGHQMGMEAGKKEQFSKDVKQFRGAAKSIYTLGQRHGQTRTVAALRQHFLSGIAKGNPGKQKKIPKLPEPPSMKNIAGQTHRKTAEDHMAAAVYEGWARGNIEAAQLQNLTPTDLEKVATVVVNRMHDGDQRAEILWRLLSS